MNYKRNKFFFEGIKNLYDFIEHESFSQHSKATIENKKFVSFDGKYCNYQAERVLKTSNINESMESLHNLRNYCRKYPSQTIEYLIKIDFFNNLFVKLNNIHSILTGTILASFNQFIFLSPNELLDKLISEELIICLNNYICLHQNEIDIVKESLLVISSIILKSKLFSKQMMNETLVKIIFQIEKDTEDVNLFFLAENFDSFYQGSQQHLEFVNQYNLIKTQYFVQKESLELQGISAADKNKTKEIVKTMKSIYSSEIDKNKLLLQLEQDNNERKMEYQNELNIKTPTRIASFLAIAAFSTDFELFMEYVKNIMSIQDFITILRKNFHPKQNINVLCFILQYLRILCENDPHLLIQKMIELSFFTPFYQIMSFDTYSIQCNSLIIVRLILDINMQFFDINKLFISLQSSLIKTSNQIDHIHLALDILWKYVNFPETHIFFLENGIFGMLVELLKCGYSIFAESIKIIFKILEIADSETFINYISNYSITGHVIELLETDSEPLLLNAMNSLYKIIDLTRNSSLNRNIYEFIRQNLDVEILESLVNHSNEDVSRLASFILNEYIPNEE
ncbi:hypothetical protein TRFO_17910 [Tritrichomonas foetus]|uniref:Uncharacterized protein n=1 Tax=Tritrichomonas foetus TaxID=1144522 RepID=A0A1J4KR94_9EUKA|nr:hypothetical protein TRFO_17910 [Tritrichomonas foetus]|eukprot:OHT12324.1 hypothetical protein TRFO_17910 [Tritrichomonas foetus]